MDGYKTYDTSEGYGSAREWKKNFYQRMTGEEAAEILEEAKASGTPYEILGIKPSATDPEIKAAFRKLIMVWHPDKNPHNVANAERMSKIIIAAYTTLKG